MTLVRVPATSANLGPGFDCLGLALGLWLEVRARPAEVDSFDYRGEGRVVAGDRNLVHLGFRRAFEAMGRPAPAAAIEASNPIPLARGLGSSSAALVAGAALADAWSGGVLGRAGVFRCTAEMEGHPDNVAPAVHGGLTVSALIPGGDYDTAVLQVPGRWRWLFAVPDRELPTEQARELLPERVTREDAVRTASRTALWVAAVSQDRPRLLRSATFDVLHEPYRDPLLPGFRQAKTELYRVGAYGAFLSGAGPTLAAVLPAEAEEACRTVMGRYIEDGGRLLSLDVVEGGYVVEGGRPVSGGPTAA